MNFQESVEREMNFYVFARDLNKLLLELNYEMVSTVNASSSVRIYKLPYYEDCSPFNFFIINYTGHVINYRDVPGSGSDTYWHALDFDEHITQKDLDSLTNLAIKIQEKIKKNKVENKLKDIEKDFV